MFEEKREKRKEKREKRKEKREVKSSWDKLGE
jgi:hypothetical protein